MNPNEPTREALLAALRTIMDPELNCNIVDLGFVLELECRKGIVEATMTYSSPGCPVQGILTSAAQTVLAQVPGVSEARVNVVWDPPWTPERITPEARARMGMR